MQLKYQDLAKEKGVYIVGTCGFDSIPADLGVNFLKENFGGTLCYAETFAEINRGPAVGFKKTIFFYQRIFRDIL